MLIDLFFDGCGRYPRLIGGYIGSGECFKCLKLHGASLPSFKNWNLTPITLQLS
jgi:hypothetical protein